MVAEAGEAVYFFSHMCGHWGQEVEGGLAMVILRV